MQLTSLPLAFAAALALPAQARAGETACWFEQGVVVVPASVMGVAGDYILDTATADTELHETRAQGAGFSTTALSGEVRLAGVTLVAHPVAVADLDPRTWSFPTPIAGVIGADVLKAYVVDVSFAPCRVALHPAGAAPRFGPSEDLPLAWAAGRPVTPAAVSDGPHALSGAFAPATGSDVAVRLSDGIAGAPGARKPVELYPFGVLRPQLRALSFAGQLFENLPAGLLKAEDGGPAGLIGTPVLSRYRLRFDFPRGRLLVGPKP